MARDEDRSVVERRPQPVPIRDRRMQAFWHVSICDNIDKFAITIEENSQIGQPTATAAQRASCL